MKSSSLSKLFKAQKNGSVSYAETNLIEAPIRKKLVDSRLMFEQAVLSRNLADTAESFQYYSISYVFAIEHILKQFATLQRRISAQGVNDENICQFGELSKQEKTTAFILSLFQQFSSEHSIHWESFLCGYRDAEHEVRNICNYIYRERFARKLTDSMIYTSFWEVTASEAIELPKDFAMI